jgi:hypothetical protein
MDSLGIEYQNTATRSDWDTDENRTTIEKLTAPIGEAGPKRSKIDESHFQIAKQHLDSLSEPVKHVIRCIYSNEGFVGGRVPPIPGVTQEQVNDILNRRLAHVPFIRRVDRNDPGLGLRATWEIVPAYKAVLGDLL